VTTRFNVDGRRARRQGPANRHRVAGRDPPEAPSPVRIDGTVFAEALESGVPGLFLGRPRTSDRWVLVHAASGLAVSRATKHRDPEVLVTVARCLAPLTDWTQPVVPIPRSALCREVDAALLMAGLSPPCRPTEGDGRGWPTEQDRALLLRVLRNVHAAAPPALFAKAIGDLDADERAHLRALLTDQPAGNGAVVPSLPNRQAEARGVTGSLRASRPRSAAH